jgi:DNA invertase Pin-like site-specific DNA recombinase
MNAIYVRVSTEEQARFGYGLTSQLDACREKYLSMGITEYKVYTDDGYSGEFIERPGLDELRQDLRSGFVDNVIFYDPDRMARVLEIQLLISDEIEKAKATLIFCTHDYDASPEGKLFFMIRGAISQFEKAKIRERTMAGKRTKALKGKLISNDKPYGYGWDANNSMYTINEKEAEIIQIMFNMFSEKNLGVRSLSFELKSLGIKNRQGKAFTASNIYRILINEMYAGTKWSFKNYEKKTGQKQSKRIRRDPSEWIPISVPAIISKELWEKAQNILKSNQIFSKRNTHREYLLRGIIRCGSCGYAMIGARKFNKGKEYLYYTCHSKTEKRECANGTIRADKLDQFVWHELTHLAQERHDFSTLKKDTVDNSVAIDNLNSHINELTKKKSAFLKWVTDGIINIGDAEKELQAVSKELAATQIALKGLQIKEKPTVTIQPEDILSAETFEDRRDMILKLHITVHALRTGWKPDDINWWM